MSSRPRARSALSLDVGRRRIGLAGCDALGLTVTPLNALKRGDFNNDVNHIKTLCAERRVEALVVGLPLDDAGKPTLQAKHCHRYGIRLAHALLLPMAFVNEHSSSWAAGERHQLHGDRSGRLDSAAAALLLEQWLADGPEPQPVQMAPVNRGKTDADARSWTSIPPAP
ncbi:MAG: Holliday junction resolvase RuvX [Synechococcus sp. CPC100]|nr:Holliday junction resolvase RuvX [Synechococcus sp. CPC100]